MIEYNFQIFVMQHYFIFLEKNFLNKIEAYILFKITF